MQDFAIARELDLLDQLIATSEGAGRPAALGCGPKLRERAEATDFVRGAWAAMPSVSRSSVWRSMEIEKRSAGAGRPGRRLPPYPSWGVRAASLAAALVLAGGIGFSLLLSSGTPAAAEFAQNVAEFSEVTDAALADGALSDGELITLNEWATGLLDQATGNATSLGDLTEAELAEVVQVLEEVDLVVAPAAETGSPVAIEVQQSVRRLLSIIQGGAATTVSVDGTSGVEQGPGADGTSGDAGGVSEESSNEAAGLTIIAPESGSADGQPDGDADGTSHESHGGSAGGSDQNAARGHGKPSEPAPAAFGHAAESAVEHSPVLANPLDAGASASGNGNGNGGSRGDTGNAGGNGNGNGNAGDTNNGSDNGNAGGNGNAGDTNNGSDNGNAGGNGNAGDTNNGSDNGDAGGNGNAGGNGAPEGGNGHGDSQSAAGNGAGEGNGGSQGDTGNGGGNGNNGGGNGNANGN